MSSQQGWQRIAAVSQLRDDEAFPAKLGEVPIALYRLDGQVFAIDDACTYEFVLLSQGFIEGRAVECPLHQAKFDISAGLQFDAGDVLDDPIRSCFGSVQNDLAYQVGPCLQYL